MTGSYANPWSGLREPLTAGAHAARSCRSRSRLLLVLAGLACPVASHAASFDCAKAHAPDEIAICASHSLNDYDVELTVRYHLTAQLLAMGARGDLREGQQAFLSQRHQCGSDISCLARIYRRRIAEVSAQFDRIAERGPF